MTIDWKDDAAELVFGDFCEENGLRHTTSCYEQGTRGPHSKTFWVCPTGCPVLIARFNSQQFNVVVQLGGKKK